MAGSLAVALGQLEVDLGSGAAVPHCILGLAALVERMDSQEAVVWYLLEEVAALGTEVPVVEKIALGQERIY